MRTPSNGAGQSTAAVIALKPMSHAKTRFANAPPQLRSALALAMALDVVAALSAQVERVIIVSEELNLERQLHRAGLMAHVVADPDESAVGVGATSGLNRALAHGAALANADTTVAAVADLPCLRTADVATALASIVADHDRTDRPLAPRPGRWFCPDLPGTGTTLLIARHARLNPLFEGGSAQRHRQSGAMELTLPDTARRDVDTTSDLDAAKLLGLGPHTSEIVAWAQRKGWAQVR